MSYQELYGYSQTLNVPVSRKFLKTKSLELTGVPKIAHAIVTMDTSIQRGMYITPRNKDSIISRQVGGHVIITARGMNYCWERFVYVKELMHVFTPADQATDSGAKFEELLGGFSLQQSKLSPQMKSEFDSFWMALGVLCPENMRQLFLKMKTAKQIEDYDIALKLRIPEQYVSRLFDRRYLQNIRRLISK